MPQASILISPRVNARTVPESSEIGGGGFRNVEVLNRVLILNPGDQLLERLTSIGDGRMTTSELISSGLGLGFRVVGDQTGACLRMIPVVEQPLSNKVDWRVVWGIGAKPNERILLHPGHRFIAHVGRGDSFDVSGLYETAGDREYHCNIIVPGEYFSREHMTLLLDTSLSLATLPGNMGNQVSAGYGVVMLGRNATELVYPRVQVR